MNLFLKIMGCGAIAISALSLYSCAQPVEQGVDYPNEIARLCPAGEDKDHAAFKCVIKEWTQKSPAQALEWTLKLDDKQLKRVALLEVYSTWAAMDCDVAMNSAKALPKGMESDRAFQGIAFGWGQHDPKAAISWAGKRFDMLLYAYAGWAKADLKAATNDALSKRDHKDRLISLKGIAMGLVNEMPAEAGAWALAFDDPETKELAVSSVSTIWWRNDSSSSIKWASAIADSKFRQKALCAIAGNLATKDPEAASKLIQEFSSANNSDSYSFYSVANEWWKRDPKAAKEWVLSLHQGDARSSALGGLLNAMAKDVPESATELIDLFPQGNERIGACGNIASAWAAKDLDAATKWALSLPDEKETEKAFDSIAIAMDHKPEVGTKWALSLPEGPLRDYAIQEFARTWAEFNNAENAVKWVAGLPECKARQLAFDSIVSSSLVWGGKSPEKALAWISLVPPGCSRHSAFLNLGSEWWKKSKEDASAWINSLPDVNDKEYATCGMAFAWSHVEPKAASKWALKLPAGELRTRVIVWVAKGWAENDNSSAAEWAKSINDNGEGEGALVCVIATWAGEDLATAEKFVYTLPSGKAREETFIVLGWVKAEKNRDEALKWALASKSLEDLAAAVAGIAIQKSNREDAGDFNTEKANAWIHSLRISDNEKTLAIKLMSETTKDCR